MDVNEFIETQIHNEKVRKNIQKFFETGKLIDENGNEIKLDETINFELPKVKHG